MVYKDEPLTVIDQDYQGRLQIGSTHFLWTVSQFVSREYPPVLDSVALVENNPHTAPRFTDQTFTATATLSDQGLPTSTKKFDAYVKGEITTTVQFDEPLDSSSVNQITRTWSNDCTSPDGASALAFNGFLDASVGSGQWTGSGSGGSVVWDTGAYPLTGNLVVWHWEEPGGSGPASITVEDTDGNATYFTGDNTQSHTTGTDCGYQENIAKITIYRFGNLRVSGFEINGTVVVNGL